MDKTLYFVMEFDTHKGGMVWLATCDEEPAKEIVRERKLKGEEGVVAIPVPAWGFRFGERNK